jgi:hypothetical protein
LSGSLTRSAWTMGLQTLNVCADMTVQLCSSKQTDCQQDSLGVEMLIVRSHVAKFSLKLLMLPVMWTCFAYLGFGFIRAVPFARESSLKFYCTILVSFFAQMCKITCSKMESVPCSIFLE